MYCPYQSDRILVCGPPTTGWYRRIRSLLAQKRGDASSPRTGQGNAWSPPAVDDASPHLLLNLQSSALAATRPLAPSRWIDDFTEVPHLRYHGTAEPMALLSIVLPLHPFLRDR
ncbi:hypothetical protein BHE74_00007318 [Ensete ventricosum]|nr:hypothetical protein GW17_00028419 [Ensete ventricosum]RWW84086.1 hypothetical protein BHE74_00007318 [Ensete ventricosum]